MTIQTPIRTSPAEDTLFAQLEAAGTPGAAVRFRGTGLPTRRVESYHYTDLKMLLRDVPPLAADAEAASPPAIDIPGAYRILVANGVISPAGTAPNGVVVGAVAGSALTERDDVLVRLNTALVRQALNLHLSGTVDPVIHIDRRMEGAAAHVHSGAKITVADGTEVTIVETISGSAEAHLGNASTFLSIGKDAKVTHVIVDLSAPQARHFATVEHRIAEGARLVSLVVHAGADLARSQVFADFVGEGAHADFLGLNLVGDDQHRDITLDIAHSKPNTTSTELFKQVGRGRGKAVFQGKILVARDAQKVDAKMMTQGLMLSEDVEILAKPELEIFADDVVCGHGATCGDLDEDVLFYLMSRGVPRVEAETMMVRAFLEEVLDPIASEALNEALAGIIDGWLRKGGQAGD